MENLSKIHLPAEFDWKNWVERWEKMQKRYIPHRTQRFKLIALLVAQTQGNTPRVLDLGCGPGSLMEHILKETPDAEVFGIDFDPILLDLAEKRFNNSSEQIKLIRANITKESWLKYVPQSIEAAISATALHWLNAEQLEGLYRKIAKILRPGGIFINADHAHSKDNNIQQIWKQNRDEMIQNTKLETVDTWDGFWNDFGRALKINIKELRKNLTEPWQGSEIGLPLQWHFEKLEKCGFDCLDCFWRLDYDAVFGGIRGKNNT